MIATKYTTLFKNCNITKSKTILTSICDDTKETELLNIYPEITYQSVDGFGGAITEASGYLLNRMPKHLADKVMASYFSDSGIGYRFIRTHLDSCDFCLDNYSAVTDSGDTEFKSFSLRHDDEFIIPYIKQAEKEAGMDIEVMLSPWSPPAFMKTNNDRNNGGKLLPEYADIWAEYICRYITEYKKRGINIKMLTLQNEPHATQKWDSCVYTDKEMKDFLENSLYPELKKAGLENIGIYLWDHNKERLYDCAKTCITDKTDSMVAGFAFHWYSGDHFEALQLVHEKYPDKKLVFTEGCIEYSKYNQNGLKNAQIYAHDIIGNFNAGMNLFFDWNIILDEEGGPNHAENFCEAPIMYNRKTEELKYNLSYYYIEHFSKYIKSGSKRIATTKYTDKIETVAFKDEKNLITVIILNRREEDISVTLRTGMELISCSIEANSITTIAFE